MRPVCVHQEVHVPGTSVHSEGRARLWSLRLLKQCTGNTCSCKYVHKAVLCELQVGAALSMVYSSGAPIMFVGCGQTYVDLTKLNVKSIVRSLLR